MSISVESRFEKIAQVDFQLTIDFANLYVDVYASDLRYTDADDERLLSVGEPADNEVIKELLSNDRLQNAAVRISVTDSSELAMNFVDEGFTLAALPESEDESWSVRFETPVDDNVTYIVCMPQGRLERFGPTR